MNTLAGRKVLVGVSGSIAAYKAAELVRALRKRDAEVRCVMTRGAREFISPLLLQTLSGNRVGTELWDHGFEHEIGHIALARWADAVVIAPATANCIARLRTGMADDLLTTLVLATAAPVLVCPSMNSQMLHHPATRENLEIVRGRSRTFVLDPEAGELACGESGDGRLPDSESIIAWLERVAGNRVLEGRKVTVTAGPTREHFDPVRYLSNPSTGRMGFALCEAAFAAGAEVTLITGPSSLRSPVGSRVVRVETAEEMERAVRAEPRDILVMAAAVADYRPETTLDHKKKKSDGPWHPTLVRTPDILGGLVGSPDRPRVLIGFAAETHDVVENARAKLARKQLDGIVANSVLGPRGAFGSEQNEVTLIGPGGERRMGPLPKREVAEAIIAWVAELGGAP